MKAIKDAHASAVTTAAFLEGNAQLALTGDAKGRLVSHNVSAYLSITSIFAGMYSHRQLVKTVVSMDRIRMLRTNCSGETRLAPHIPSSLSWKAFLLLLLLQAARSTSSGILN